MTAPAPVPVPGWSARQLATLATMADAFAPGFGAVENARRASDAAELLNAVADPVDVAQLRLVVTALEMPTINWLTGAGWAGLSTMGAERRERLLLAWAESRIGPRRTAFQAFKRALMFLAYTDPGSPNAPNPGWTRMGYAQPATVEPPPPTISPLLVDRGSDGTLELEAEAVVVGSGAGGGVVANRLAERGRDVLVIEAGPYLPESAMPTLEREAYRRLYLDRGATATDDLGITIVAGAGLGGGTTINWTTTIAPPERVRAEWAAAGLDGFDGAETDADFARLRNELGLHPPSVVPAKDRAILDGAASLGWEAAPTQRNAGPCSDCGACGFGCRRGAKRSGLRVHLARAHAAGARVLVEASVTSVTLDNGAATGVKGVLLVDGRPARPFRVRSRQVMIAGGALRTPLLLEASGISHPHLGRHLSLHPAVVVVAFFRDPIDMWLGPMQAARSLQFLEPGPASGDGIGPAHGGFFIETGPAHPGLAASAFPWQGGAAAAAVLARARFVAPLGAALRDAGPGRVFWSRAQRPRIQYRLTAADQATARRGMVEVSRLARAAGAVELLTAATPPDRIDLQTATDADWTAFLRRRATADFGPNRAFVFSAHQMGTARAGADPATAVCDPHGRVRMDAGTVRGLYVADGSLLPSAPGVNPMLSIMAVAERVARAIAADA